MVDFERELPTEDADIAAIVQGILALQASYASQQKRPLARGTHAKGVCARAEFEVFDVINTVRDHALAARLARGLFAKPGVYPATVRFANADSHVFADGKPDVRAMSFSVHLPPDVLGPTATRQDYSMNNATTFPINDAHAFAALLRVVAASNPLKGLWSLPFRDKLRFARMVVLGALQKRHSVRPFQQMRYWSTTPFRHGADDAVKYSAIPSSANPAHAIEPDDPNCLQDELIRHLDEDSQMSSFDFTIQFLDTETMTYWGRRRPASFWIENASVEWNEAQAPFHVVGRLRLLPKSQCPREVCEAMHIDVTEYSTADTAPLGSINRARWAAESGSRKARLGAAAGDNVTTLAPPAWRSWRRPVLKLLAVAALLFVGAIGWALWPVSKDLPDRLQYPPAPLGNNGLTTEERQQYYHLTEGGEMYPMAWLLALEQTVTGPDGSVTYLPFLENVERFGMIPDPPSPYNPYGLPVGVTIGYSQVTGLQMMGFNCTACHVGELHYNGRAFRMDGGPTMAFFNNFVFGMFNETQATVSDPRRLARFVDRRRRVKLVRVPRFPVVEHDDTPAPQDEPDELLDTGRTGARRIVDAVRSMLTTNRGLLASMLESLKAAQIVKQAITIGTLDGYGRADAFGIGRNELFGAYKDKTFTEGINALPPDAPVSFPHLWGMQFTSWFQWGVNTNSVIQRNIGQALGVGALVDPKHGFTSTVRLDHLYAMESLSYKLKAPQWPAELFGPIDQVKVARGKVLFDHTCALCHETYGKTGVLNEYQLFPLSVVGTDPAVALNFERMVMTADGPKPFGTAAFDIVSNVMKTYYREHNISEALQAKWERRDTRPHPVYRTPLRDYNSFPDTRNHGIFRAKTLKGIWATAPFLHNGSVPTIYHLLLPADRRPQTFALGTREYDPVKLGYVFEGDRFKMAPNAQVFSLDTSIPGNWNTGHEWWFYPQLTDEDRYDVIEFLKTFNDEGDYQFTRPSPAQMPATVRGSYPLPPIAQAGYPQSPAVVPPSAK
jgi:hypothetical protein